MTGDDAKDDSLGEHIEGVQRMRTATNHFGTARLTKKNPAPMLATAPAQDRRVRFLSYDEESQASTDVAANHRCKWWITFVLFFVLIIGTSCGLFFFTTSRDTVTVGLAFVVLMTCIIMAWNLGTCARTVM